MSYTKTNWQSGDVISAEKLNKMEDGITSAYTTATSAEVKADSLAETIIDFNNLETVEELGENDKVLVNSGGSVKEADASLIGGGSGSDSNVFLIEATGTKASVDSTQYVYFDNVTYNDILTAYSSGKDVRLHLTITNTSNGMVLSNDWSPCICIGYGMSYDYPDKYVVLVSFGHVDFVTNPCSTLEEALALHPAQPSEYKPGSEPAVN